MTTALAPETPSARCPSLAISECRPLTTSPTGSLNYELSGSIAGANDVVAVSGNLTMDRSAASNQFAVNVTPVDNALATGSYPLITYGGSLSGTATGSNFTTRVLDVDGNPMAIRQSVAVDTVRNGRTGRIGRHGRRGQPHLEGYRQQQLGRRRRLRQRGLGQLDGFGYALPATGQRHVQ